jgi:transcription-repair coupling factor (superfamily II helicase)
MNVSSLVSLMDGFSLLAQAEDALLQGVRAVQLEGVPASAKGLLLAHVARTQPGRPLVIVSYSDDAEARLVRDLKRFLPEGARIGSLPSSLSLLLDDEASERDVSRAGQRLAALIALANGESLDVLVLTATALCQKVAPPEALKNRRIVVATGDTVNLDALAARLTAFGYLRSDLVSLPGTFARRGDLLDIFPSDGEKPVRIDLFGDDIESIRHFDIESQRSEGTAARVVIVPAHEVAFTRERMAAATRALQAQLAAELTRREAEGEPIERRERRRDAAEADITRISQAAYFAGIERYLPLLHPDAVPLSAVLPTDALWVLDEPAQMGSHAQRDLEIVTKNLQSRAERGEIPAPPDGLLLSPEATLREATQGRQTLLLTLLDRALPWIGPEKHLTVQGASTESFASRPGPLAEALSTYVRNDARVVMVSAQAPRLRGILQEKKLPESPLPLLLSGRPGIALVDGVLEGGFRLADARVVVFSDAELFGSASSSRKKVGRRQFREGMRITSLLDVKSGDYVVHIHHGIGQYHGLTRMTNQGVEKEYLLIAYDGGDRLYVPVDQVDRVQKYIGSDQGGAPAVNKLGGAEWARTTAKATRQVREIAGELIALYAARQGTPGFAYSPDTPWVREMEDAFPYIETPDQLAAIEDVKHDLEQPRPMDRLICGDVGYGKTEVAIRAAFKVASEGRQVAVLCPTTVLAAQHFSTFTERLAPFPVRIDQLSRFRSAKQLKKTIDDLKIGAVDIVVGTHRLLSKDVAFKDLGLVIVDEEQRFGVVHKERLKQLRKTVDVLTMTATPIPRTMHMSLSGIRDISLINDPPEGRTPVKTYIKEYDDLLIREAILREVDRGGQVYFIHNRVESIRHVAGHLERIVPTARFRVAHGQMHEDELEETMLAFYQKEFDVLVCTTIVESGLDIPNVNTILIDNADKLGLAQLYQLRGRVGRSPVQAFAYVLHERHKTLSTIAEQRLDALREFSDLGSGYKIALRDLELRGAGNLLGAEQSGTVAAVGFDLFTQLLEQALREQQGEEPEADEALLPTVDLPVAATIPPKYVPSEPQRILMYKKLAAVRRREDVATLQDEFEDRFGTPPQTVWNALNLLRLRLRCQEIGIDNIATEGRKVIVTFARGTELPRHTLKPLAAAFKAQAYTFEPSRVTLAILSAKVLPQVEEMVEILAKALVEPKPPLPERRPLPSSRTR